MGQPKLPKKKYLGPGKLWEKTRILDEKALMERFGYKNKKEIWKMDSLIRNFRAQARRIVALENEQSKKEEANLLSRLIKLGLLEKDSNLDDVLDLSIDKISERRLLTLVIRKGLARTPKQARQFITHRHILVGGKKVTSPNYLVPKSEEASINFAENSPFFDKDHPLLEQMRQVGKSKEKPKEETKEEKEATKEEPKKEAKKSEEKKEESKEVKKEVKKPEEKKEVKKEK